MATMANFDATTIAAPPPSRGHITLRPQVARRHAAGRERNAFGYGKCLLSHQSMNRDLSILTNLFVFSHLLRVPAPQLRSQVQQQRGGRLCVLFCRVLAQKVSHLWRQRERSHIRIFMYPPTLTNTFAVLVRLLVPTP